MSEYVGVGQRLAIVPVELVLMQLEALPPLEPIWNLEAKGGPTK
jgi:hypothetical protein